MLLSKYNSIISVLFIFSIAFSQNYRGAEYRTKDTYLYGRFEVKFKSAAGDGIVSSFFTYNDLNPTTPWNEIDIEILGRYNNILDFTTITDGQNIKKHNHVVDFNPAVDYHIYAFEWTPTYVAWFVDGEEVFKRTDNAISLLKEPQKIMMNIWNPVFSDWVGDWNQDILPRFAFYDYVSYSSYTPGTGDNGTDFSFEWIDEFSTFVDSLWEKSDNHTWAGNQALFVEENISFTDGKLVLCLTDESNLGLTDIEPPKILWTRCDSNVITIRFSEEIDPTLANDPNNYLIQGQPDIDAELLNDYRTVILTSVDFVINVPNLLVVKSAKDIFENPNTATYLVANVMKYDPLELPIYINVGGVKSGDFLGDTLWSYKSNYGSMDGSTNFTNNEIARTELDPIYQSSLSRLVKYKVRVPNGKYNVRLMFSENHYNYVNARTFDVFIQNEKRVVELDVFSSAGNSSNTAYDIILNDIIVQNRILDLTFSANEFGNGIYNERGALLNGIVIEKDPNLSVRKDDFYIDQILRLEQNYPNPFNSASVIRYELYQNANITLKIYNSLGQELESFYFSNQKPGNHFVSITDLKVSGIYYYKIIANYGKNKIETTKKMIVLK